jgi:shikimate kinase
MAAALGRDPRVISAGGGWAAEPGNLEAAAGRGLTIYLSCTPATAARRTAGSTNRPLLRDDPLPAIEALLARRLSYYQRADVEVDADRLTPEDVAALVVALARSQGGW